MAGTPLVVQNTGTVVVYIASSELEPTDNRTGLRAPVGSQAYDARPTAPEKTWVRASGKTKPGRIGVQA